MMERYREYKESGVKWLGEIPSHWEVVPIKYISEVSSGATPKTSVQGYWDGNITWVTPADFKTDTKFVLKSNRNITTLGLKSCSTVILPKGSLVFSKRAPIGQVSILKKTLCTNQGCFGIIPKESMNNSFLYYSLAIHAKSFNTLGSGTTFRELSFSAFSSYKISVPPKAEQDSIVRYLDSATSEIDKAIAMQQKMIDLLNERKQIIIQNAVTKGLDENVEMKESGVEWIGRIPKHWEVKPLKYTGTFDNGLTYSPNEIVEDGVLVIRSSNIQYSKLIFDDNVFVEIAPQSLMVQRGDIIICSRNGSADLVGKCAIVEENINATFGAFMMRYTPNIDNRYAFFLLQTAIGSYKGLFSTSTINQLTKTIIGKMKVPLTEMSEQQQIAAYLDSKMQRFDTAISNCQRQITLLKERKQIIINEVVTGKVRVS